MASYAVRFSATLSPFFGRSPGCVPAAFLRAESERLGNLIRERKIASD